jgi:meiosis-specific transcription factor NDT80
MDTGGGGGGTNNGSVGGYGGSKGVNFPPLQSMVTTGQLEYVGDGAAPTAIKADIGGAIDKGFFLADGEWTCYRRNYFSCTCSFSLSPNPLPGSQIQYTHEGVSYPVRCFMMSISATVADEGNQAIDLVQHTPKRDKGPTSKPEKVRLDAKQPMSHHHAAAHVHHQSMALASVAAAGIYHPHDVHHQSLVGPGRGMYDTTTGGFISPMQGGPGPGMLGGPVPVAPVNNPTEYTFERIQFKQATANNGKRRAAQQYYHLCIELWAECPTHPDGNVKVASRKSAKVIVRGRSPGHYADTRRNSTSNGPGGSAGSISGFPTGGGLAGGGSLLGPEFPSSAGLAGSGFGGPYELRGNAPPPPPPPGLHYGAPLRGPRDIPSESYVSPEEDKSIHHNKEYQYYPGSIYENQQDSRHGIPMFTHSASHRDDQHGSHHAYDSPGSSRIKSEGEGGAGGPLPSIIYNPGPGVATRRCQPFEGKHTSNSYYPTLMPPMGLNMAHIS